MRVFFRVPKPHKIPRKVREVTIKAMMQRMRKLMYGLLFCDSFLVVWNADGVGESEWLGRTEHNTGLDVELVIRQ